MAINFIRCPTCDKEFLQRTVFEKYCSDECTPEEYKKRLKKLGRKRCEYCGKFFKPFLPKRQKYCSQECAYKSKRTQKLKKEIRICSICGKKFTPITWNQKICSYNCRDRIWRNLNLTKPIVREYFLEKFNWICQKCGKTGLKENEFHCHHIKFLCKGGKDSEDNITLLCRECHKRLHSLDKYQ